MIFSQRWNKLSETIFGVMQTTASFMHSLAKVVPEEWSENFAQSMGLYSACAGGALIT